LCIAETLPRKLKKQETPLRLGVAYWMMRADGAVALQRRPPKGLLGGMMEVPGSAWTTKTSSTDAPPLKVTWRVLPGKVVHVFTHFRLELEVWVADLTPAQAKKLGPEIIWTPIDRVGDAGLPSIMTKVAVHAMKAIE
jgi:A/G-specific adenine glycosylase